MARTSTIGYARQMRRVHTAFVSLVLFVSTIFACETTTDSSLLTTGSAATTSIYVHPSFFMGDLPCTSEEGGMQSYVAALYDVSGQQPVALPASPPTSCKTGVTFRQVVVGRSYRIKIDGYDLATGALVPLGGATSGSRTMVLKSAPEAGAVTPRWTTYCDDVVAAQDTRVNATTCEHLALSPTQTGLRVDARVAMKSASPALTCKQPRFGIGNDELADAGVNDADVPDANVSDAEFGVVDIGSITVPSGTIAEFKPEGGDIVMLQVRPDDPSLPPQSNLSCSEYAQAPTFTQGITPGKTYTFRIEAFAEVGGPVVWGSSCFATAKEGLVVDAVCDPFRTDGAMEILIVDQLGDATCHPDKIATYDVDYAGPPKASVTGVPCGKSVRLSPLAAGPQVANVVGRDKSGNITVPKVKCTADIEPGVVTIAKCAVP